MALAWSGAGAGGRTAKGPVFRSGGAAATRTAGNGGPGKGNALGRFRIAMAGAFGRLPCGPATGRMPVGSPETPDGRPQGRTVCLEERPNGRPSSHLVVGVL